MAAHSEKITDDSCMQMTPLLAQTNSPRVKSLKTEPYLGLQKGDPGYIRASIALLAAAVASFNALYCTQALLPQLTNDLHASPAQASLTVSAATAVLALSILPASILSERFGRGRVIIISALAATILGLFLCFAPNLKWLIFGRALQGLLVAGVPATAMAWLAQEIHPRYLPRSMGFYVAGNTIGGLLGRLIPSSGVQFFGWRLSLGFDMVFALTGAILIAVFIPKEKRFTPKKLHLGAEIHAMAVQWRDKRLVGLYFIGFIYMGVFVSLYDFLGYRFANAFGLPTSVVGCIFLLFLFGTVASSRAGILVARFGRVKAMLLGVMLAILGMPLVASHYLWITLIGIAVFTYGFFVIHSIASGWVGELAPNNRAEASGSYLMCYYIGSSLISYFTGLIMHAFGWSILVVWLTIMIGVGLLIALMVARASRNSINGKKKSYLHPRRFLLLVR